MAESWRSIVGYPYDWHLTRLVVVTALAWLVGVELAVFLVVRFPLSYRRLWLALSVVAATVPLFSYRAWDPKSAMLLLTVFGMAVLWVARALYRRLPGSLLALAGSGLALVILLIEPRRILDQQLYLASTSCSSSSWRPMHSRSVGRAANGRRRWCARAGSRPSS